MTGLRVAEAVVLGTYEYKQEEFAIEWAEVEEFLRRTLTEDEAEYLVRNYDLTKDDIPHILRDLERMRKTLNPIPRTAHRFRTLVAVEGIDDRSLFLRLPGWHRDSRFRVTRDRVGPRIFRAIRLEKRDENRFTIRYLYAQAELAAEHPKDLGLSDWELGELHIPPHGFMREAL